MRALVLAVGLTLLACVPLSASEPIADDGQFLAGERYFYRAGTSIAYTRTVNWYKSWYLVSTYNGCRCTPYWSYTWESYYTYQPVKIDVAAADIEDRIIELARDRDKAVLAYAAKVQKSEAALALIDKLGLAGNFAVPNYGAGVFPVRNYANGQIQLTQQGTTAYATAPAYQVLTLEARGIDPLAALTLLAQAAQQTGEAYRNVQGGLKESVDTAVDRQLRFNEYLAKGGAASKLAEAAGRAVEPANSLKIERKVPVQPPQSGPPEGQPDEVDDDNPFFAAIKVGNCASCHSGPKAKGGFLIDKYNPATATAAEVLRVYRYLSSDDDEHRCPPKKPKLIEGHIRALVTPPRRR